MDEARSTKLRLDETTTMRVSITFKRYIEELRQRFAGILKGNELSDQQLTDILAKDLKENNIRIKI